MRDRKAKDGEKEWIPWKGGEDALNDCGLAEGTRGRKGKAVGRTER